jgi:hypothetical protein
VGSHDLTHLYLVWCLVNFNIDELVIVNHRFLSSDFLKEQLHCLCTFLNSKNKSGVIYVWQIFDRYLDLKIRVIDDVINM